MRCAHAAHGIRRDGAHAALRQGAQTLAEACETGQRAVAPVAVEAAVALQAGGHAHAVAQPVDHAQFAVLIACDDHVIAVGTQVDGREQLAVLDGLLAVGHANLRVRWADGFCHGGRTHGRPPRYMQSFASRDSWAECGICSPGSVRR